MSLFAPLSLMKAILLLAALLAFSGGHTLLMATMGNMNPSLQ